MTTQEFFGKSATAEPTVGEAMKRHLVGIGLIAAMAGLGFCGWRYMHEQPEAGARPFTHGTLAPTDLPDSTSAFATPATAMQAAAAAAQAFHGAEQSRPAFSPGAMAFPRGLADHAALALQQQDGHAAMAIARALEACQRLPYALSATQTAVLQPASPAGRRRDAQDLAEQQAVVGLCQTAPADLQDQRRALYGLAASQQVPGAARAFYDARDPKTQNPAITRQVRADAERGDLMAMSALAESQATPGVLSDHEIAVYRLALVALAKTQEWGPAAETVLAYIKRDRALRAELDAVMRGNARQAAAARAAIEQSEVYDLHQMTPQAQMEAQTLVQGLLKQKGRSVP